jgi:type IV pilus assembly protein PilF
LSPQPARVGPHRSEKRIASHAMLTVFLQTRPRARPPRAAPGLLLAAVILGAALLGACRSTTTVDGVRVDPTSPIPGATEADAKKRAAVRLQLASNYYQSGQLQIAIDTVNAAIALDPSSAVAYGLLGLMMMDAGQPVKADESFRRAMALDRDNPELNNNYGWFLCQTGHERESLAYFDRASANALYQTPARSYQNAGICLLRVHDDAAAEKYLLRALAADGTSPVAKFHLAQMYLHQRRFDRCDFYFDLLTRSVEADPDTLWLGARIAHAKGDDATEHRFSEQLQLRFPTSPQADAMHHGRFNE